VDDLRKTIPGMMIAHRYELLAIAGQGGMATVWRGQMRGAAGWARPVAVKKMRPEFRAVKNYIDMFVEEARVGSDLNHPNIVQVYDFIQDKDRAYYLVMEWVEGIDLHSYIYTFTALGELTPWALMVAVGIGALRGLAAAHERKSRDGSPSPVVHRDVSPGNILLDENGTVKLTDFGLARAKDRIFSLTAPGVVKGKLSYLSPEITVGRRATPRSDLFAMGSSLWEALAGERLFQGETDLEIFSKIRSGEVRRLEEVRPDVPSKLAEVVHRALSIDPDERQGSAREMANELAEVLRLAPAIDGQSMLAESVRWARQRSGLGPKDAVSEGVEIVEVVEPAWSYSIDIDIASKD